MRANLSSYKRWNQTGGARMEVTQIGLLRDSLRCEQRPDEMEVREQVGMERPGRSAAVRMVQFHFEFRGPRSLT